MSERDVLNLEVASDTAELPRVRDAIRAWSRRHGWSEPQVADIALAIDEALSNVIRHGYGGKPGYKIELVARALHDVTEGEGIEVRIRDYGKQVPPDKIRGRDLEDIKPGGLGVHIIRSVMASVEYSYAEGGGMQLVMRKYQRPQADLEDQQTRKP
ncbi:MAG: ATP-binding protein [Planctomycetes bacterium]|nr:ATP-binding protein [Planctomycetota bacterium]